MRRIWFGSTALMLVSVVFLSGCATSPGRHLGNLKDDLLDITRLNAGAGPVGYGVHLKATEFVQFKAENYENVYRIGWIGRGYGIWKEKSKGCALCTKQMPITTVQSRRTVDTTEEGKSVLTETRSGVITFGAEYIVGADPEVFHPRMMSLLKEADLSEDSPETETRVLETFSPADEFRAAVYLGVAGADVGVRPVELFDFVFSFLTLGYVDIRGDDHGDIEPPPAGDVLKAAPEE